MIVSVDAVNVVEVEPSRTSDSEIPPRLSAPYWGCCPCGQNLGALLNMSFGFFLLFFSYNVAQNYAAALWGNLGYASLGVIYVSFSLSSLASPSLLLVLGEHWGMTLGAVLYAPFMFSNAFPSWWLMLPCALLNGIGAGLLWSSQGVAVVRCASRRSRLGHYSGLFFGILQSNQLVGNLFSALVLNAFALSSRVLFLALTGILLLGVLLFIPMRFPERDTSLGEDAAETPETLPPSMKARLVQTFKMIANKRFLWLIIPIIFNGTNMTFAFGKFPALCGTKLLGYVMAVTGFVDVLTSFVVGKLSDKIGKRPVFFVLMVCSLGATWLSWYADGLDLGLLSSSTNSSSEEEAFSGTKTALLFVCAVLFGVVDSCSNTQLTAVIGLLFPSDTAVAFGAYRFVSSITTGIWFAVGGLVPLLVIVIVVGACAVLLVIDYLLLDRFVTPVDAWRAPKLATSPSPRSSVERPLSE